MAYSDSIGDNARLVRRTVIGLADFSGRSRRTEVIYYLIATALVSVVLNFVISTIVPFEESLLLANALQLVLVIPMFALFVRRLHDQDKSGWWGFLLPLSLLLSIPGIVSEVRDDAADVIAQKTSPMGVAAAISALAVLVLFFWRGTDGPNRFGPDPRLEEI